MTAKTLKRLERAAMRFHRRWGQYYLDNIVDGRNPGLQLIRACAVHANAQRKGAKRKGRKV